MTDHLKRGGKKLNECWKNKVDESMCAGRKTAKKTQKKKKKKKEEKKKKILLIWRIKKKRLHREKVMDQGNERNEPTEKRTTKKNHAK